MSLSIAPPVIEQTDFSGGWMPDYEESSVPEIGLVNVSNLLPDIGTGTLQTRPGFKRLAGFAVQGYEVAAMHPYSRRHAGLEENYLILVLTNKQATVNNVRVYAFNLKTGTLSGGDQISPADKEWDSVGGNHFGFVVDDTFYGGGELDPMYSWNPTDGWVDDASAVTYDAFISDKAYKDGDAVLYDGTNYSVAAGEGIRFDHKWETDSTYESGDQVRHKPGAVAYWKAYRCVKKHNVIDGGNREPGVGENWQKFWKEVKLPLPKEADGVVSKKWDEIPDAPVTNVANFHGDRMWGRHDIVGRQYAIYSALSKLESADSLSWDPADWKVDDETGAGYIPFKGVDGDDITAFYSFGFYQLIFKRHSVHVVAGYNPLSWNKRQLAPMGAIYKDAVCEHDGLVYFIGDRGFYVTDGASVQEVPGADKVRDWLKNSVDWDGEANKVTLWSHRGFVWASLPTDKSKQPNRVLVYHPETQSFWKLNIPVAAVAVQRISGIDQMFFAVPTQTGTLAENNTTYSWAGTPHRSKSSRSDGVTNHIPNPSFEPVLTGSWSEALGGALWAKTTDDTDKLKVTYTHEANHSGVFGVEISTDDDAGSAHGLIISTTTEAAFSRIYAKVRRKQWKTHKARPEPKFYIGNTDGTSITRSAPDSYEELGNGWWLVSFTFFGSTTAKHYGVLAQVGNTLHVDDVAIVTGTTLVPFFHGYSSTDVGYTTVGGDHALIMQLDHPDVREEPTDDIAGPTYTPRNIGWFMRTAWFPFGAVREDRRIRRVWGLVRGSSVPVRLMPFRNYEPVAQEDFSAEVTTQADNPMTHVNGLHFPDSYAIAFKLEGFTTPAAVIGISAETQTRRVWNG